MPPAESSPPVAAAPTPDAIAAHSRTSGSQVDAAAPRPVGRRRWPWIVGLILIAAAAFFIVPWVRDVLTSVSTDDAYVNGHVTQVAPRVAGQVTRVLVDDNNFVHKGDLLVELDPEPYQVQVNIAQSVVDVAQADLTAAQATVRGQEGFTRSLRFSLEHAIEDVDDKIATLKLRAATLEAKRATLTKAQADFERNKPLVAKGAVSQQQIDAYMEAQLVAQADVQQALQGVYQIRVALGLPSKPEKGDDLTEVPADLNQTFSSVREAQAKLMQAAAALGVVESFNFTPQQLIDDFYKRDPKKNIDTIYDQLLKDAPAVKQAEANLLRAQANLDDAQLNLRYTKVYAEIDGVITRRNVNPGNNVVADQSLMAIRSVTEIWIDANFKETQIGTLRIGQPATIDVDMYGSHHQFAGRISGFTMGTGSTLALLPPQNATGNFVKVVQRLPVRIDLTDYDPQKLPLFIGLSVTPSVRIHEEPTGPNAGRFLQEPIPVPMEPQPAAATTTAKPERKP
ncbi:MAG TPA: HlyD family secretion protein [Lacipirellulaceae bacterium]|jgi:membrane fusion protein (multidrug efflux system)|nr:HlyD family secretion protein [Lacipirellulaceae bacterium]